MKTGGLFVVSLDFELYWGMFDKVTLDQYGENILGVQSAIPEMLALFREFQIHATWATVGMLIAKNEQELQSLLPSLESQPRYEDMTVSAYEYLRTHAPLQSTCHFAPHLVEQILITPFQELGSHTFSHYYCLDGSENGKAIFASDCEAFTNASSVFNQSITSIVFPRNQATNEALQVCGEYGFTAYRGTPNHFLYTGKRESEQVNPILRILRLIDTYINLTGHHTYAFSSIYRTKSKSREMANVQGSWFLRPHNRTLNLLEWLKIRRIKNAMTYAAKQGQIYHLWWHPHNFGINRKENLQNLIEIITHFKTLQERYGMQSANMRDIRDIQKTS